MTLHADPRHDRRAATTTSTSARASAASAAIDLAQYKRGQMERRIRTFADRAGTTAWPTTCTVLRARPRRARRVPRPRDDQRLPALAQPGAVEVARARTSCPSSPQARPRPRLERRLLLRRRGLHARRRRAASAVPRARVDDHAAPTSTARMVERARDGRLQRRGRPQRRRPALLERWFTSRPTARCEALPELRAHVPLRGRRPAARPAARRAPTTSCCAATPSSTSPTRCATRCTRASRARCGPAATSSSARPSASSDPAGIGLAPTHPFTYRKI